MPELPEVETTAQGIRPHILNRKVIDVVVRQRNLRVPVTRNLKNIIKNQKVIDVSRRAKYVLIKMSNGCLIVHLGMTGTLQALAEKTVAGKHDHIDIAFDNKRVLRFSDPRKFGLVIFTKADPLKHKLLAKLGPEPLEQGFNADHLYRLSRKRKGAVKNFVMNNQVVVGVGNIYASESLFRAGILPHRQAGRVSKARYELLYQHICEVLGDAIILGGTTLRDYANSEGFPGYFQQKLDVYGREGQDCNRCGKTVRMKVIGQRSSFYCTGCQR